MNMILIVPVILLSAFTIAISCRQNYTGPSKESIAGIKLKRGDVISCGAGDRQFGEVHFDVSDDKKLNEDFTLGVSLLHSFEYDEAAKVFARIIDAHPD